MTKVEAIKKVMEDNGGTASWEIIYNNIDKYYPSAKVMKDWKAGIRGVLYREIKNNRNIKNIGFGIFALKEYTEEDKELIKADKIKMHSYIEGICVELGNFEKYNTFTADPSKSYKDNIYLNNITSLKDIPNFTYPEIINVAKRIDVLWFNKKGFLFPKRAFEIVDSIGTLGEALNRTYQLSEFNLNFYIIGKENDINRFTSKVNREPYNIIEKRYIYKSYDEIIDYYNKRLEIEILSFFK